MDQSTENSNPSTTAPVKHTRLVDVPINNQNDALQLIVNFLNLAQKRGAFTMDESAKIWECIKTFQ
jgi:hypothetical protein